MRTYYWFGIYLLLGLWLGASPYVLGFVENTRAYWNSLTAGAISLGVAIAALYYEREQYREQGFTRKSKAA